MVEKQPPKNTVAIFDDPESRRNIVGLFDLLLKIAKRNPKLWAEINKQTDD